MHYCLKDPQDQVVGLMLEADTLGHEIYRILDWADEHFSSYSVDQSDGQVYVHADRSVDTSDLHSVPLSLNSREAASNPSRDGGEGGEAEPVGM